MDVSDRRMVVVGDGPMSSALSSVYESLGFSIGLWNRSGIADPLSTTALRKDLGVAGDLRPSLVDVTTIWPDGTSPPEVIRCIRRLRGELLWEGRFVAVMTTDAEKAALENASVVPGYDPGGRYAEIRGHATSSLPLDLPDLIHFLMTQPALYVEEWSTLLDRGVLKRLRSAQESLASALESGRSEEASRIARAALGVIRAVEWWILVRDHRWERTVRNLIREQTDNEMIDLESCWKVSEVLEHLKASPREAD